MKTDDLKEFLSTMGETIEKDKIKLFEKIVDGSEIKRFENPNEFFYAILYPWEKFISGYLKSTLKANRDVEFIFTHSQYIDRHFYNLFGKYEGSACSADKSRTIVNRLLEFYATGKRIEFDYESEYIFHLPKKIFKEHDLIVEFYEGLKNLLYGDPTKYLMALNKVFQTINQQPPDLVIAM